MAIIYIRKQKMSNDIKDINENSELAENGVVVTEAMIEAGASAIRIFCAVSEPASGAQELAEEIFLVMALARSAQ